MRRLATIAKIESLEPIPNADRILKATVRGWECVVSKSDNFNVGDKIIFVEVDSILPPRPEFAFMKDRKYRVKTIKLRKQISQGLILPMSYLKGSYHDIGDDVTKELGITKYDPQAEAEKKLIKDNARYPYFLRFLMKYRWFRKLLAKFRTTNASFPTNICSRTDEERCLWGRTKIDTDKGKIALVDIVNNPNNYKVLSYNECLNKFEYKPVLATQTIPINERLMYVEYVNRCNTNRKNRVVCTKDHPFYVGNGYKNAGDLQIGDIIYEYMEGYPKELYSMLYGMVLGDSNLSLDKRTYKDGGKSNSIRINFSQGEAQIEYLKFKLSLFGDDNCKLYRNASGFGGKPVYNAYLKVDYPFSRHIYDLMFKDRKKVITKEFCDLMTPETLAFWYMDDGSLKHKNDNKNPSVVICSCAYSKEENELLVDSLKNKFGIDCHVIKDKKYYSIFIGTKSTPKFLNLIAPYVHPSMRYKLTDNCLDIPFKLQDVTFHRVKHLLKKQVTDIGTFTRINIKTVYDITVADNHNFFANNILTHNCQNIPKQYERWYKDNIKFYTTEKLDGCSATYFLNEGKFGVCSRNVWLRKEDDSPYWEIARRFNLKGCLKDIAKTYKADKVVIQGEIIGKNIQGNKYHVSGYDFFVYNIIINDLKVEQDKASYICKELGLNNVPVLNNSFTLPSTIHGIVEKARGKSLLYDMDREGIVVRNYKEKISFKVINPDFLLKNNE